MEILNRLSELTKTEKGEYIFISIAFIFMVFSMFGWVMEVFFRRFVSTKKWINPGFLKGPYLPIYGIGVAALMGYVLIMLNFKDNFKVEIVFELVIIIGIGILMTLNELIGGLIFIKGMNIRLWDYSNCKFNYKGVICLEYSLIWTVLGAVFYFFLFEPISNLLLNFISLNWFLIAIFLIGIFYGIFFKDLIESLDIAAKIKKYAKENNIVLKLEKFKVYLREKANNKESNFLEPFKFMLPLKEHIKEFIKEQEDKINKKKINKK